MKLYSDSSLTDIRRQAGELAIATRLPDIEAKFARMIDEKMVPATLPNTGRPGHVAESDFPPDFFWDQNFISVNAGSGFGLYPMNYFRANAQAERLTQSNGFYFRCIEIAQDHVCGEGLEITADATEEELKDVIPCLNKLLTWNFFGPENEVDMRYRQWVFESLMSGMLCLPAIVRDSDGFVEYGDLPARWITDVIQSPQNASDILAIRSQPGNWVPSRVVRENDRGESISVDGIKREMFGQAEVLPVIRYERKEYELDEKGDPKLDANNLPIKNEDFGQLKGSVFLLRLGNLRGQKFGQGDGFHIHDLVTELEQIIFLFRRAYEIQMNLIVWMKYSNIDDKELDKKAKMVLPTAPLPLVTNDSVSVEMLSPGLKPTDLTELVKTLARFIAGIMGLPEYTMGDGTSTNVATAEQQAPIMYQKFVNKRRQFESFFGRMGTYVIHQANKRGMIYRTTVVEGKNVTGETVRLTAKQLRSIHCNARLLPFPQTSDKDKAALIKDLSDSFIALLGVTVEGKQLFDPQMLKDMLMDQFSTLGYKMDREAIKASDSVADNLTGQSATGAQVKFTDVSTTASATGADKAS